MTYGNFGFRLALCISLLGSAILSKADEVSPAAPITAAQQEANKELARQVRIGNSSIWIAKYQYDRLMKDGILPEGVPGVTLRGPITKADVLVFQKLLAPYLDKNHFKNNQKPKWYKPDPTAEGYWVYLDSEGGDVYSAMTIGRMFRKARVYALLSNGNKCMSSCVLLLAGAVNRSIVDGARVGIHRPYSTDTDPASFDDLQAKTTKLGVDVSAYLSEMNNPNSLYESMKLIPSENIKILSYLELETFGLNDKDPVFAELNDNAEAKRAGVSKSEFLARKALSKKCQLEGMQRLKPSNNSFYDTELAKMFRDCDLKIIYKDVVDERGEWRGTPDQVRCRNLMNAANDALSASDWRRVLEIATERERVCAKGLANNELADIINDQASAYLELGSPQKTISTTSRCLRIANIPYCHITKGQALLMLSRRREGAEDLKLGKQLADREVSRLTVELQGASSASETENLKSELEWYKSQSNLAQAILTWKP